MAPSLKLNELTGSHTDVAGDKSLNNLYFIWATNKARYESLPDDLKAVIDANSGFAASAWAGRAHDIGDVAGKKLMAADGNQIAILSEAEAARTCGLGEQVIADWIAKMTAQGLDAKTLVSVARAAVQATRPADAALAN